MNYLGNAIKFTDHGNISISIDINREIVVSSGDTITLKIEVKDSGCGISNRDIKKLFRQFMMLDATKSLNPNGTGLGLSICKKIAERLGGTVWVSSREGQGSTFGFSFKCSLPTEKQIEDSGITVTSAQDELQSQAQSPSAKETT